MDIKFFNSINLIIPKNKIYSRLGYAKGKTKLEDNQRSKFEDYIEQALAVIKLKGVGRRLLINKLEPSRILLKEGINFKSESLTRILIGCQEVLFIAATAGPEIGRVISDNAKGKNITAAVVFDAVASEAVDSALGWIINYFNCELIRENRQVASRRFSAGYGDFLLENQKIIFDILRLGQLGVSLSEEYMLIPEKTVTAVAGIRSKK